MRGAELREALRKGERVYGVGVEGYVQPRWPRFFANRGLDFVFLGTEHAPLDRMQQAWAVQTYAAHGIAPLLRIPEASPSRAAQAMDAGAHGIVVPYMETVAQVKKVAGAVRYRPFRGLQLDDVMNGERLPSAETEEYLQNVNHNNLLIIMIESQTGLNNLDAMLAIGGVDGVLIGPNDLSISLGIPDQTSHPLFSDAVKTVIEAGRKHNVGVGVHFCQKDIETEMRWIDWGCNLIIHLTDTLMIAYGIEKGLDALRAHTGDQRYEGAPEGKPTTGGHAI